MGIFVYLSLKKRYNIDDKNIEGDKNEYKSVGFSKERRYIKLSKQVWCNKNSIIWFSGKRRRKFRQ